MNTTLQNGRTIGDDQPAFIIAEIGQNHQGERIIAEKLIDVAVDAKCDAVKLTKRDINSELTTDAYNRPYEGPQSFGPTYGLHREAIELSVADYEYLDRGWHVPLFATACDIASVDMLEEAIDPPLYKVASRDIDNIPLIDHVAATGKPVVLSTGFGGVYYPHDLEDAVEAVQKHHNDVIVLYCVSKYPTPDGDIALANIGQLRKRLDCLVGFSDHTIGIHLGVAAVQAGACVVEKHITMARANKGTDHAASLEPEALRRYVRNIRGVEAAMRKEAVQVTPDAETVDKLGRSLVAAVDIHPGVAITEGMLCLRSPGDGFKWHERGRVVGRLLMFPVSAGSQVTEDCLR